ncbi:serine/threonine protein phosphatase [Cylindrospermum stagnale PCC 7417]|uniref:Serine/threonine protein phosphatase n=1 Tax=Cylindrospermum stagnale PCC 7417 TaxID=56107 RepID=K9WYV0_9NOST|nr:serine/threonine phosphatase [Cylindrospermum stagnale]AFZ24976.1 serine/threonine protein phosphatase [Cylindrospermum stagnale PCC 7417]
MLICPDCKFENPDSNKFCQNCGTSLTHKVCPECSTDVALNAQHCHNCGAECGTVWWAMIAQKATCAVSEPGKVTVTVGGGNEEVFTRSQFSVGSYLDQEQRYQLLEPLPTPADIATNTEVGVRVLDCQPYQVSPIEAMLENEPKGLITPSVGANGIPSLAKAYIGLQSEIQPGIPLIHDAWQQGGMQVVLIEDRSYWQPLLDLWQNETTSSLQILHWCYQMTQLWAVLEPVNCRQSLLELSNLRLDEDQTLALQRLYVDSLNSQPNSELATSATDKIAAVVEQPLTIKALGQVWQTLFRHSQRTQFGSVVQMLEDLELGEIETLAQLRSRLEEIATELEVPSIPTTYPTEERQTAVPTILQLDDQPDDTSGKSDDLPTIVLSMQLSSLEDAGRTDVGRQRRHNEDYFGIETKINKLELPKSRVLQAHGLYILCDGMGGHAGGEVASQLAVTTLQQYFQEHWTSQQLPTEDCIREAVYLANQTIYNLNQKDARSGVGRMGTTLVLLLLQDTQVAVAHVGDSRLYRLTRKRGLEQVTVDHEVGQREIARGVETSIAYARPDAYQLTQALGPRDEHSINPDVAFFDINEDTLMLLASDGLSDNDLLEINWQTHLEPLLSSGANLELGVTNLIDLANQHNGHDNITAVVIRAKVRPNQESLK